MSDKIGGEILEKNPVKIVQNSLGDILEQTVAHLPNIATALVLLLATWALSYVLKKFGSKFLSKSHWRTSMKELVITLLNVAIWLGGLMFVAIVLFPGLTPSKALGAAGLVSVAVGLAFKDIFQNFFAGVILMWKFPFEPGDFIECGEIKGKVLDTQLRLTEIRSTTGELIVVPNAFLVGNPLEVLTEKDLRRMEITTGVAYGEDVAKSIEVIEKALESCAMIDSSKPRDVIAANFGASSIDIEVLYWAKSPPLEQRKSRSEVIIAVKKALDEAGIEIPFPYRTMTFAEPLKIQSEDKS